MLTALTAFLRRHWFILALAILFVGLGAKYSKKALQNRSAILRWQPQVLAMEQGEDISQRFNYPNPPIMAILLEPLAHLPPVAAALIWFYVKVALTLLSLVWIFRLVETPERPFPAWAKALTILLSLRPIMGDLDHGNVNLFILFLVVAALTAYRRKLDFLAGTTLALAIACKVTPALFLPYFVWKRSWRALAGTAAGLALFLWPGVVPGVRLGFPENQRQLASWYRDMVYPFLVEGKVTSEHNNQSLAGVVYRLTTHSPSFSTYVDNRYTPVRYDNLLDLPLPLARLLVKAGMGLFALAVVWSCRTPTAARRAGDYPPSSPWSPSACCSSASGTWKHHCVTLVLPFAVLSYYLAVHARGRAAPRHHRLPRRRHPAHGLHQHRHPPLARPPGGIRPGPRPVCRGVLAPDRVPGDIAAEIRQPNC